MAPVETAPKNPRDPGSAVRKSLGIAMDGPDSLQRFVMAHFGAALRSLVRDCPGVLYRVSDL